MSTATEISRLSEARNTIRDKLVELGLSTSTAKLDVLATAVDGISNRGAVSATVQEGDTYTIPAGYHNGSGTVSGVAGGGNYSLQSKTATPTKSQQSITPDSGYYGLSDVTVAAIPAAYQNVSAVTAAAADVLSPKVIVTSTGETVTGTMPNVGTVSSVLDATTGKQSFTIAAGKHSGSGSVSIVLETKTATPTTSTQNITPTTGKVLSKVTIDPIPDKYKNVTNVDVTAADVLSGKVFVNSTGEGTGTMTNVGTYNKTLDVRSGYQSTTIPEGYHSGSGVVQLVTETKSVTPSESSQTITPTNGKVLSQVTVGAISSTYVGTGIARKTSADMTVSNLTVTAPAGYYASNGTKTLSSLTVPKDTAFTLSVTSDTQLDDTSTVNLNIGNHRKVSINNTSGGTVSIGTTGTTSVTTPTFGSGTVSITAWKNAASEQTSEQITQTIVSGGIWSETGSATTPDTAITATLTGSVDNSTGVVTMSASASQNVTPTVVAGFISTGTAGAITVSGSNTLQLSTQAAKTVTPSTSVQTAVAAGKFTTGAVTVARIPVKYGDTSDDDAVASNILSGKKAHSKNSSNQAVALTGTMPNNGLIAGTIDGLTTTSYTIPGGYTSGGSVSLTNDIETALAAI